VALVLSAGYQHHEPVRAGRSRVLAVPGQLRLCEPEGEPQRLARGDRRRLGPSSIGLGGMRPAGWDAPSGERCDRGDLEPFETQVVLLIQLAARRRAADVRESCPVHAQEPFELEQRRRGNRGPDLIETELLFCNLTMVKNTPLETALARMAHPASPA
jgi:hypothetical protein